ncbi:MAG: hypothetical protein ABFD50_10500 [Smithella sp.]
MSHEKIEQARANYKNGVIKFAELNNLFIQYATEEELSELLSAPVFDRVSVVKGKSKSRIKQEWNSFVKSCK